MSSAMVTGNRIDLAPETGSLLRTTHHLLASAFADLAKFAGPAAVKRWEPAGRVLVEGRGASVTLTAWDLDTAATVEVPAGHAAGRFIVDHGRVAGLLRDTGKGRKATEKRAVVMLAPSAFVDLDQVTHPINAHDVDRHPAAPDHLTPTWRGASTPTRDALVAALRAAGDEETLPMLTVANLAADEEDEGTLVAQATDRFRLDERRVRPAHRDRDAVLARTLFPSSVLFRAVARFREGATIGLATSGEWCTVTGSSDGGTLTVSTRPFDGEFPRVGSLWPTGGASATVDRAELVRAVEYAVGELARSAAQRRAVRVRLKLVAAEVMVSAYRERDGEEGGETWGRAVDAELDLDARGRLTRAIAAPILLDALAASDHPTVTVVVPLPRTRRVGRLASAAGDQEFVRPLGPVAFVDHIDDLTAEHPARRHLVMPVGKQEHVREADLQPWDNIAGTTTARVSGGAL